MRRNNYTISHVVGYKELSKFLLPLLLSNLWEIDEQRKMCASDVDELEECLQALQVLKDNYKGTMGVFIIDKYIEKVKHDIFFLKEFVIQND